MSQSQSCYNVTEYIIGKGSFGVVKLGIHRSTGKMVAVKTESKNKKSLLSHEYKIMKLALERPPSGAVHSLGFWEDKNHYYLAMNLMGPSIDAMHKLCSRSFSLKTTLMLAQQMLDLVHYYHSNDVLHRDIKPSNFLINYSLPHERVGLIDFGLAKKFKIRGKQIPYSSGASQVGSLRYMSKHIHSSIEPSCRDDLYSLGYCIIFMFTGILPWQGDVVNRMDKASRKSYMGKLKWNTSKSDLLCNCYCITCRRSPNPKSCTFHDYMMEYFTYLDGLEYETPIDYKRLSNGIRECFKSHGFIYDHDWDWRKYYISSSLSTEA